MSLQIESLNKLIHELTRLPGIGEKTAQRLAYFILREGSNYNRDLQEALGDVLDRVKECVQCFSYTDDGELCRICRSSDRDSNLLCVVEEPFDIGRVESSGAYRGFYHVLQGTISPLEGVLPEHLRIQELLDRIDLHLKNESSGQMELILALDADLEGDTTALYISKVLGQRPIKKTRLAHGVPFGTDIDYIDRRTLGRALENRVEL